jgi:hypothetical protein
LHGFAAVTILPAMAEKRPNQDARAQRLARQLRENLKRRKAQARTRKENQADVEKPR